MATATVLVVDYHRESLNVARSALTRAAFEVLTAADGEEGLGILKERTDVDLVITEALMPSGKISGPEFVENVKQLSPSTAVMMMTGFTDDALDPAVPLLMKPFAAATLVDRVQRVLADSRRQSEEFRAVCRKLDRAFETNRALRPELESVVAVSRSARMQSRRRRVEWLCTRLREPGATAPTVLVAEDDEASRYAVCRILSRAGLTVLEASNGAEALEIMRERGGSVDMLLADVRMPGIDGLELAQALAAEYERTSILFMTGEEIELPHPVIRKPFEPDDLLGAMAEKLLQCMRERHPWK